MTQLELLAKPRPPRLRLTAPVPSEQALHEACARALDTLLVPPALWASYPAGHIKLAPAQAARLIRCGLKRGWPDVLVLSGALYGLELKRPGKNLSKNITVRHRSGAPRLLEGQQKMFEKLVASGGFRAIAVAHSVDEMLDQLVAWGIPLRGRVMA